MGESESGSEIFGEERTRREVKRDGDGDGDGDGARMSKRRGRLMGDGANKGGMVVVVIEMTKNTNGEVEREAKFKIKNSKQKG